MKAALWLVAALGMLLMGNPGIAHAADAQPRVFKLAVVTPKSTDTETLYYYLPVLKGWTKAANIDFQAVAMSPTAAYPALAAGQIDGLIYSGSAALAGARGAPMVSVYYYTETADWPLVAAPKLKDPASMKGARCGSSSGPKAGPDIACRMIIKALGGDPASLVLVNVPGGALDLLEAFRRNVIDMTVAMQPPVSYQADREGFHTIANTRTDFPILGNGLTVNRNRIKDPAYRALVVDVIRGFDRASAYMRDPANKQELIGILRESMNDPKSISDQDFATALTESETYQTRTGILKNPASVWTLLNGGVSLGFFDMSEFKVDPTKVDPIAAGVYDPSLAEEAAKAEAAK